MPFQTMTKTCSFAALAIAANIGLALAHGEHQHGSHAPKAAAYGEPGNPAEAAREVLIVMKEGDGKMLFVPDTIAVKKGEQVRLTFRNEGFLDHEFVIGTQEELDEHADLMLAMPDMVHEDAASRRLSPKATANLLWRFTTAGEFPFACLIPGHREAGMTGKVIVQ